jgi:D-psicose/D-tagatose/L-ribulose 3-epimerase
MKLAFSNIAWPPAAEGELLGIFANATISGIEVAPTRLWPDWTGASPAAAATYAQTLIAKGFSVPALQAILFAKPELLLFGSDADRQQLADHLQNVADLAVAVGAKSLVFGAPKNRQLGDLHPETGFEIAREFFRNLAPYYERSGICLCLEANPLQYACTFATNSMEAARLVRAVNSPGFGLHLDTACMFLAGENVSASVEDNLDLLQHFHVSEPFLDCFAAPKIDHAQVAAILRGARYRGWVSLEMRETDHPVRDVQQAAEFLARTYIRES